MGKLQKYKMLKKSSELERHLPPTKKMSRSKLATFSKRFGQVILKPNVGCGGKGVIKITRLGNRFTIHFGNKIITKIGEKEAFKYLNKKIRSKKYIIQKRIKLAEVSHRPFDLRVMVQRKKHSPWKVTGMLAKVAGKGFFITNVRRSGGYVLPIKAAIKKSFSGKAFQRKLLPKIKNVAIKTAKRIDRHEPHKRILGLDMGIDKSGKLWIIEVNYGPDVMLFNKLKDKIMLKRILSYKKG